MPVRRDWESLTENYRKRIAATYGLNAQFHYESGGSLQRARGHKPREFARRRERNPKVLSSNDYRFLRKQAQRMGFDYGDEDNEFVAFYKSLDPGQRSLMRDRVAMEHRAWRRRGMTKARDIDTYTRELRDDYPWFEDGYVGLFFYH